MADAASVALATRRAPRRSRLPFLATLAVAVALAGWWLAAPPLGTDLSAQVARADFFAEYGWAPIDFRWYGGVSPHGYSLLSPPLMAWFGPRPVGAAAAIVSALALVALLRRTGARRPMLGGVLGAVCFTGNLVSGRVTFALGIALALLALSALIMDFPRHVTGVSGWKVHDRRRWRALAGQLALAGLLAALAAAASPVAGLFVGLAGVAVAADAAALRRAPPAAVSRRALPAAASRRAPPAAVSRRAPPSFTERGVSGTRESPPSVNEGGSMASGVAGGAVLAAGAAVPIVVMAGWLGSGGWMNISRSDMLHAVVASLAVAALVPHRAVRVGALLSAAGVLAAYLVHTPVGLNATRLATLFALPLVAAYADVPGWLRRAGARATLGRGVSRAAGSLVLALLLAALAWWQPPVLRQDLTSGGDPTAGPGYFAPLAAELAARSPAGRVEVIPTAHYWESAHLATPPLARGWLRQVDLGQNPLFFEDPLDPEDYRRWLVDNGVSYVALATAPESWVGRPEAALVRQGVPYLTPVWSSPDWTLYAVAGEPGIVAPPATLLSATADRVEFTVPGPGPVAVKVRWSRWLAISGSGQACLAPAGDWTTVQVTEPGRYWITGSLTAPGPRC